MGILFRDDHYREGEIENRKCSDKPEHTKPPKKDLTKVVHGRTFRLEEDGKYYLVG